MERFVKGSVVVVPFPFSDLTQAKSRPALIIAELEGTLKSEVVSSRRRPEWRGLRRDREGTLNTKDNLYKLYLPSSSYGKELHSRKSPRTIRYRSTTE